MHYDKLTSDKQIVDLLLSTPQSSIFCTPKFLKSLNIKYEFPAVFEGNKVLAYAIVFVSKDGQVLMQSKNFCMYQGLLVPHYNGNFFIEPQFRAIEFLFNQMYAEYQNLYFENHYTINDVRPFSWFNYGKEKIFKLIPYYTGIVDVSESIFENYLSRVSASKRKEYRLASQSGLSFHLSDNIDQLVMLYELTFDRQGIALGERVLQTAVDIAKNALTGGYGEIYEIHNEFGEVISSQLTLYYKKCAYFVIGGNHPNYRELFSSNFVILEGIKHCMIRGINSVDLCGMNSPNRGQTKASYGVDLMVYFIAML